MSSGAIVAVSSVGAARSKRPPAQPRGPLPPFDTPQPPAWLPVHTTLPPNQIIPPNPTLDWPRANWFDVEIPGLPWVEGQSSEHPFMVLTYFLQKYSPEWQDTILYTHALRGYSHFMLSWTNARQDGLSVDQFVALALKVKSWGFFVHVMLAGKDTDPHDQWWDGLKPNVQPVLEALIAARAVDMVSMWETNLWNAPGAPLQSILQGISDICKPAGVRQWVHFGTECVWWGEPNYLPNRTAWWAAQVGILTGILYQGDVNWCAGDRQAHIGDSTNNAAAAPLFADGTFKFCAAEMDGMLIYTVDFSENIGDLHGFQHLCTPGITPVSGFCNGARYPDGSVI